MSDLTTMTVAEFMLSDVGAGYCDFCGRERSICEFETSGTKLTICTECVKDNLNPEVQDFFESFIYAKNSNNVHQSLMDKKHIITPEDKAEYLEDMSIQHPEFMKCLQEYLSGAFTLDSGEQDPMLESISSAFMDARQLSEKQRVAFRNRCAYYCELRSGGHPLIDKISTNRTDEDVKELFNVFEENKKLFSSKEREFFSSLQSFFADRGYLTAKQFAVADSKIHKLV